MTGEDSKRVWGLSVGVWTAIGALAGVAALVGGLVFPSGPADGTSSTWSSPPAPSFSTMPSSTPASGGSVAVPAGVSRTDYLAQAERKCLDERHGIAFPPDRNSDPQGFGRWLEDVAAGNKALFDRLIAIVRPAADEALLGDLYAQRQHANDLYSRAAAAFNDFESVTGEQFLASAMQTEADFRNRAKSFGFDICVGSDTPGR